MKFYLIQWKETEAQANCFPYLFKSKEEAECYIYEATYFPREFEVIEVEPE